MTRAQIFEWHRRFKEIKEVEEDDSRRWGPSTSRIEENVERVRKIECNRRLTLIMAADELGMNS